MKTLVVYSGGMDSTVLLYKLVAEGVQPIAFTVDYGQRHRVEKESAAKITSLLNVKHIIGDLRELGKLFGKGSSQADPSVAVPEGHYAAENMALTVVPNRNMILMALAAGVAIAEGCERIAYGAHAGDHAVYADCRPEFADAMGQALALCHIPGIELHRPFINMTKSDIATLGYWLNVPFELTWSCYKGGDISCGRCSTDVERMEAMYLAGVPDKTVYEDTEYWKQVCGIAN